MGDSWPRSRIEQLRKLYVEERKTFLQIAAIMRTTRSAIAGKVARQRIKRPPEKKPVVTPPPVVIQPKPVEVVMPVKKAPPPYKGPISMHDMRPTSCRFLIGEARELIVCGADTGEPSEPWCPEHRRKCYAGSGRVSAAQEKADPMK